MANKISIETTIGTCTIVIVGTDPKSMVKDIGKLHDGLEAKLVIYHTDKK